MLTNKRWLRAQEHEKLHTSQHVVSSPTPRRPEEWRELMHKAGLPPEKLPSLRILDIGGVTYLTRVLSGVSVGRKVILDPLIGRSHVAEDGCEYFKGVGEQLPLDDGSIDFVHCANTIDHTSSPTKVLREIARVLISDGRLYISCNVFSNLLRPAFPVFDVLDGPHPHHFSSSSFQRLLLTNGFVILHRFPDLPTRATSLKTLVGGVCGLTHVAFRCMPAQRRPNVEFR